MGIALGLVLCAGLAGAAPASWHAQARVAVPGLSEASGLAASRRQADLLWTHNDSGHAPELFGIGIDGRLRERVRLDFASGDWEEITAFDWRGRPHLAIADTGDNFAWRTEVQILVVGEPESGAQTAPVERVLRVRYPQGPRDVEAIAVDARRGRLLLLEKRLPPARLYAVDLDGDDHQVAREIGIWPAARGNGVAAWKPRDLPTAMALDDARGELWVMTYLRVLRYRADDTGDWAAALARGPVAAYPLPRDGMLYEALAVDARGNVWALSEGANAPLLHGRFDDHATSARTPTTASASPQAQGRPSPDPR
jgi:hypothetical protein